MSTNLLRFKVINFRSTEESVWINVADNTCLVGVNEAGKTNLLVALWKLNPANGEAIYPLDDYPRHLYSKYKPEGRDQDVFIKADFELDENLRDRLAAELECDTEQVRVALIERKFNGDHNVSLPYTKIEVYPKVRLENLVYGFESKLIESEEFWKESEEFRDLITQFIHETVNAITLEELKRESVDSVYKSFTTFVSDNFGKRKNLPAMFEANLFTPLRRVLQGFDEHSLQTSHEIDQLILKSIPKFVYYSDYGNLDSEIYLPRVIEDFGRDDLTESARAKARTLRVLFKYVNLSPEEIYELGNDRRVVIRKVNHQNQAVISEEEENPSAEEIADWSDKKRERNILLDSAASELTKDFRNWWQQGNYIFTFNADGNHFRINVSDKLRPEALELERRSRGLQWFFSFYLVFLVETEEKHVNTVLLLDEPGQSLHPIAKYDLVKFFRELAKDNQLVYTTHSPFLIDMDNVANVKAVYINKETGRTEVSTDLRHDVNDASKSFYPVHAALGLTVSDVFLIGCQPVLVEGTSDQIYLNLIKRYLIGEGKLQYSREIVFIPTGARKGATTITNLITSRDGSMPYILLDSDHPGNSFSQALRNGVYSQSAERVLQVGDFLGEGNFEIEDLMPSEALVRLIDRKFRGSQYFEEVYDSGQPIVNQVEKWLAENGLEPEKGWKVELARDATNSFDRFTGDLPAQLEENWTSIFDKFVADNT